LRAEVRKGVFLADHVFDGFAFQALPTDEWLSLCWRNTTRDVRMGIIRGTPTCCAEVSREDEARNYDEPNGELAHVSLPRV
jgi:hypothetical protein